MSVYTCVYMPTVCDSSVLSVYECVYTGLGLGLGIHTNGVRHSELFRVLHSDS